MESLRTGGPDAGLGHDVLGKNFARFQPGGVLRRTEDFQLRFAEFIGDAQRERGLRTHDGEIDAFALDEGLQLCDVIGRDRQARGKRSDSGIARRAEQPRPARTLRELPDHRMFPSSAADDKNFHSLISQVIRMFKRSPCARDTLVSQARPQENPYH